MEPIEYIDAAIVKLKCTDYRLSLELGYSANFIANIRSRGANGFDNTTAIKLAKILELDPITVIADVEIARAQTEEKKAAWVELQEALKGGVSGLAVALPFASVFHRIAEQCILCSIVENEVNA